MTWDSWGLSATHTPHAARRTPRAPSTAQLEPVDNLQQHSSSTGSDGCCQWGKGGQRGCGKQQQHLLSSAQLLRQGEAAARGGMVSTTQTTRTCFVQPTAQAEMA